MKAAISTDGNYVSAHFGRCPTFTIVDINDGKIVKKEELANPGHEPGYIPDFLNEKSVNCIIAGGMGMRAQELFSQFNIQAIMGVSGKIDDVIKQLINGELKGGESLCKPGDGKGYGVEKTECDHGNEEHHH
ncbi:MAG: dinitrogenase iron-molybdenum cofactor [Spirochaetes bacterium GWF1_41_5]|nr:MAG: dinitrogenase iron-molybdenum cofactor [Spirochaetes bacterium GWF1_41_5]HBE04355.1 dinitrogenase iron-molybdenum cofactor [Spirochaetia bacterium]